MKNVLIVLLIVLCSIWLLWIKLHQAGMTETATASTPDTPSNVISKPKTEREFYQALNRLIRVFESDLTLENLMPITTALNTDLPRTRLEDRYRLYTQLEQAIAAYTSRLNTEQAGVLERFATLRLQLFQQIERQQFESQQPEDAQQQSSDTDSSINAEASAEMEITSETEQSRTSRESDPANTATQQTEPEQAIQPNHPIAQAAFEQQWPQFLKQGLSSKQQQLLDALAKQQIEVLYVGEGTYEFWLNPNYWVEHVAPHLPKADQVYFQQLAEQAQQPYAYDAGLVISWLQLGTRVQVWTQYVQDYPDGYFVEMAQAKRDDHLNTLLVGMDNTPTHEQGVLLPEVQAAYAQLTQQYPNSRLSKTLRLFEQQLADDQASQSIDVPAAARRAIALAKDQISR